MIHLIKSFFKIYKSSIYIRATIHVLKNSFFHIIIFDQMISIHKFELWHQKDVIVQEIHARIITNNKNFIKITSTLCEISLTTWLSWINLQKARLGMLFRNLMAGQLDRKFRGSPKRYFSK